MPGGSGLLEHLAERWEEVCAAALELLTRCPSACATSCIDCLQTYRNRFYHEHLDRHVAAEVLAAGRGPLVKARDLPEHLPKTGSTTGQPQTFVEAQFKRFLAEAGLPAPICQRRLDLGAGYGATVPDFFYAGEDEDEPGLCIYLDGMAAHLHGGPDQARKDQAIRAKLESLGYEVLVVRSFELDDKEAVVRAIARIAKHLVGKEKQRALKADSAWFERATLRPARARLALRWVRCPPEEPGAVPIFDLRVAAGAFSEGQDPQAIGFARVEGAPARPGLFVARVVGDSMDRVAPEGSWCLWQHTGAPGAAAPAVGEDLIVRRPDGADPELGRFTFKRLSEREGRRRLDPVSHDPRHRPIPLTPADEVEAVARFVGGLED
jgi:SOS-response transcriptional repressor LexA